MHKQCNSLNDRKLLLSKNQKNKIFVGATIYVYSLRIFIEDEIPQDKIVYKIHMNTPQEERLKSDRESHRTGSNATPRIASSRGKETRPAFVQAFVPFL